MDFTPMKEFMDRLTAWRIPGNSISVCHRGKEVFRYVSGYADLEKGIPMSEDGLFNIWSCSKVATVTAALQLYERGLFLLDDPLYEYIPAYRNVQVKEADGSLREAKAPITLRHLFTMTSGLTYAMKTPAFEKARVLTDGKMNTVTVAACIAEDPLSFDPGVAWQYSLSHDVLAAVVEVVSGMRFRDYVKKNIFEPLDMKESYYHTEDVIDRVLPMYRFENGDTRDLVAQQASASREGGRIVSAGKTVSHVLGTEYDSGGAGITTSVSDYSKFVSALSMEGLGATGERILSAGTVRLMRENQLSPKLMERLNWTQIIGYGYGLGVRTLIDVAKSGTTGPVGEFGWGGAAGATVLVDTENALSAFYTHHMLNPQEEYYQPRLRNVLYNCFTR